MKKPSRIIISIYLVVSILALSVAPALAYNATSPIDYVAFGDSVASGVRGGFSESGSDFGYTDYLASYLSDSGVLSSFSEEFCTSGMTAKLLAKTTAVLNDKTSAEYKLVKNAELATLTIGANDLLAPLYAYIGTLNNVSSADMTKVKELLSTVSNQVYDGTTAPAIQANIETILQNIINASPLIKIYIMGYYNPLPMVSAIVGVDMSTPLLDFNVYIQKAVSNVIAKNTGVSIYYVDTMAAMAADVSSNLAITDIHPTTIGYKVIAAEYWKQIELLVDNAVTAAPMNSTVLIDGKSVSFEAYNINDNNYFKLRDIAMALNGTGKKFNVGYNSQKGSIILSSKTAYAVVVGELTSSGNSSGVGTAKTLPTVYLDGNALSLATYPIGGYNYIKLRDLAAAINFGVTYTESTNIISISTAASYAA